MDCLGTETSVDLSFRSDAFTNLTLKSRNETNTIRKSTSPTEKLTLTDLLRDRTDLKENEKCLSSGKRTQKINSNMPDSSGTCDRHLPATLPSKPYSVSSVDVTSTGSEISFAQENSPSSTPDDPTIPPCDDPTGVDKTGSESKEAFVILKDTSSGPPVSPAMLAPTSTTSPPTSSTSPDSSRNVHRQLNKLKRFLATLQQFGNDISVDIGEKVRFLVYALVTDNITIEKFHDRLQDATNFPLRPFVVPFLKSTLPILQAELQRYAQAAKMTTQQYLLQHERFLHNTTPPISTDSKVTDSIGHMDLKTNGKRPHSERSVDLDKKKPRLPPPPPNANRGSPIPSTSLGDAFSARISEVSLHPQSHSPSHRHHNLPPWLEANGDFSAPNLRSSPASLARIPPRLNPLEDPCSSGTVSTNPSPHRNMLNHRRGFNSPAHQLHNFQAQRLRPYTDPRNSIAIHQPGGLPQREHSSVRRLSEREWAEEYKSVDYTLTYIAELVEKTRHSLLLLHRTHEMVTEESSRYRRYYEEGDHFKRRTGDLINETEKRVSQARKQAEDELIEAKRRLVAELERTVANSESRAHEILAAERAKLELAIADARRQAEQEVLARLNKQEESQENCWNCGRKAQETCSGCNVARYCGSFCQHKDWENHHKVCGPELKSRMEASPQKRPLKSDTGMESKRADSAPESPAPSTSADKKQEAAST